MGVFVWVIALTLEAAHHMSPDTLWEAIGKLTTQDCVPIRYVNLGGQALDPVSPLSGLAVELLHGRISL